MSGLLEFVQLKLATSFRIISVNYVFEWSVAYMKKLFKWLLAGAGLIVILIIVVGIVLPKVIDPNDYKEEISAAILKQTGQELSIDGEIKWSVFPSVGLELSDVNVGKQDGPGGLPILKIGEAGVTVKLMPLFNRKIEVGEVNLADVSISTGFNPDDLTASQTNRPAGGSDTFVVVGIEISNANLTVDNVKNITDLEGLKASNIELGKPFNLKGSFSVKMPGQGLSGDVDFSGLFRSATSGKRFQMDGLELLFRGNKGAAGDSAPLNITMNTNANVNLAEDTARLSQLVLKLNGLSLNGDLNLTSISNDPQFSGQLRLAEFNPKAYMQALGKQVPQTRDQNALTRLQAEMRISGSLNSVNMQSLTARLDKSTIRGNLKIDDFDQPQLDFDLQVDQLNLDDYMSGPGKSDLSVEVFRGIRGGGGLRISTLVVAGLTATNANLTMAGDGSSVRLSPINARFYGGQHEGDVRIDASGARPIMTASHGLTGVQTGRLLEDLTGSARLQGVGDIFLQIRTDISNSRSVFQSLSGDIGMSVLDGEIVGLDVVDTIGAVTAALGQQAEVVAESRQGQNTKFSEFTITGVFDHGILTSNDLLMQSPSLRATGEGTFNLAEESINYLLNTVLLGDLEESGLARLSGVPIPVKLTGNLYEPDINVDIAAAIAGSQKK